MLCVPAGVRVRRYSRRGPACGVGVPMIKKLLLLVVLVALGAAVAKKVRDA
jgi:hypothetical protein